MEFEWGSEVIWLLVGLIPVLLIGLRRVWKWYHGMQSSGNEKLSEHVARVEKEFGEKEKSNET